MIHKDYQQLENQYFAKKRVIICVNLRGLRDNFIPAELA